jgi:hypothetical protein
VAISLVPDGSGIFRQLHVTIQNVGGNDLARTARSYQQRRLVWKASNRCEEARMALEDHEAIHMAATGYSRRWGLEVNATLPPVWNEKDLRSFTGLWRDLDKRPIEG